MVKSIEPVKYADSFLGEDQIFRGGNPEKKLPIIFAIYLIKTEKRLIAVDAGCVTMPGFDMRNFITPAEALKQKTGISAEEITDVIITHSHHDHIEAVKLFENAVIHISEKEYEAGKHYIPENAKIKLFSGKAEIDPGVTAVEIGGHSEGSSIVEIQFDGKNYVICGDECYSRKNLTDKIVTGCSVNPKKSAEFIEKYSDTKYITLLCHDI